MTATAAGTAKRDRVSLEAFIQGWESSNSVPEVAQKLGLKVTSVQARASKYRHDGIPLKEMQRGGGPKVDKDEARALLAKLRGTDIATVNAAGQKLVAAVAKRAAEKAAKEAAATPAS